MVRLSRRKALSLSLASLTMAGCVFQEGDWGTRILIRNAVEEDVTAHAKLVPESAAEPVYETDLKLKRDQDTEETVRIQSEASTLRVVVEVDQPVERTFEDTVKSGHDEIWIVIYEDAIKTGGSSTM